MNQLTEQQLDAVVALHDIAIKLFQTLPMAGTARFDLGKAIVDVEVQFQETFK